jgi:hypothetical protein
MTSDDADAELARAKVRGFLVIGEPFDPESRDQASLLTAWGAFCEQAGRNVVFVLKTGLGLWRAAIAFRGGADAEMAYVRHELREAFHRHLDGSARSSDEAWYASSQDRRRAEALAFELAAIDAELRDEVMEDVFLVHDL